MSDDNRFNEIIAKCWIDAAFKKRFVAEPKAVLAEYGTVVPDGFHLKVVENTEDTLHLVLPPPPNRTELSDGDLDAVSGGAGNVGTIMSVSAQKESLAKLRTINLATAGQQMTCQQGKECWV